jgi:hypothetical protein
MSYSPTQRRPPVSFLGPREKSSSAELLATRLCNLSFLSVLWIPENGTRYFRSRKIRSAAILAPEYHGKGCELQRFLNEIDCTKVVPEEEKELPMLTRGEKQNFLLPHLLLFWKEFL